MQIPNYRCLLRVSSARKRDRWHHQNAIRSHRCSRRATNDLAGAIRAARAMGVLANQPPHTAKILRLSMEMPMIIEIVDSEEKDPGFLPVLRRNEGAGM